MRKKRKLRARAAAEAARVGGQPLDGAEAEPGDEMAEEDLVLEEEAEDESLEADDDGEDAEDDDDGEDDELAANETDDDGADDHGEDDDELAANETDDDGEGADDGDDTNDESSVQAELSADSDDTEDADPESSEADGAGDELAGDGGEPGEGAEVDPGGEIAGDPDAELTPAFAIDPQRLKSILESLLFAAEKPLTPLELRRLSGISDAEAVQTALDALVEDYRDRGVALYDVAGGYQFRTHPTNSEYVQRLIAGRPVRLSRAQLETLAIIAYRQPVTRPEIDEIRGVDSGSTLKVLLDRTLIRVLGKKEEPGRPLLYGTSKEFLEFFNLSELRDLPTLREFHELTDESLREVEALDQSGHEDGEPRGVNGEATGDEDGDPGDESSAATTH
jgi:segregation and condensation protein B